ncbi:MAG: hypothetical protein E6G59_09175 [Actinobacteria bacterium]|nr:MAG: hypothetical protein E6G59_09175 [Actinomycetota bacterium]
MNVRLPRGRALMASIALAVVVAGIIVAVARGTGTHCPSTPVVATTHAGTFLNNRGWFGVDPALDTDNRALQAFLDARAHGSCAESWIGKGAKIGRGFYKGPEGTYYGWGLYTFHQSPPCLLPGEKLSSGRFTTYSIDRRLPTNPSSDGQDGIGNKLAASPGRYTYAIGIGDENPIESHGPGARQLIDVVGPGVNRYGKRLPAVILGEFEQEIFSSCPPNATPLVNV